MGECVDIMVYNLSSPYRPCLACIASCLISILVKVIIIMILFLIQDLPPGYVYNTAAIFYWNHLLPFIDRYLNQDLIDH